MMNIVIQKALLENDFMIEIIQNTNEALSSFNELTKDEIKTIHDTTNSIIKFFINDTKNDEKFISRIHSEPIFREHVLEYSKQKFTYLLAAKRMGTEVKGDYGPIGAVWCS